MNAEQAIADHQRMLIHAAEDRREIEALRAQNAELVVALEVQRNHWNWISKFYPNSGASSTAWNAVVEIDAALAAAGHK
jgi:hypothetical protein